MSNGQPNVHRSKPSDGSAVLGGRVLDDNLDLLALGQRLGELDSEGLAHGVVDALADGPLLERVSKSMTPKAQDNVQQRHRQPQQPGGQGS